MSDNQAYCIKCRDLKTIAHPSPGMLKNGRRIIRGRCPDCGTRLFRLMPRVA